MKKLKLLSIPGYYKLTKEEKKKICNGTGASGTPKWIIKCLDNICGLDINYRDASNIHDFCYYDSKTWIGKIGGDILYLINMNIINIEAIFKLPLANVFGNLIFFPITSFRSAVARNTIRLDRIVMRLIAPKGTTDSSGPFFSY